MPLEPVLRTDRLRSWQGEMPVANRYSFGVALERFFRAIKDEGQILGTPCARCGVTYVPGRIFCERCFDGLTEWKAVGPQGTVEAITLLHVDLDGSRLAQPRLLALVKLDGAGTVLLHYLEGASPGEAGAGLRVEPVFKPAGERIGSILDIRHFRPA